MLTNVVIKNRSHGAAGSAAPLHGEGRWFESSCEHLGVGLASGSTPGMWSTGGAGALPRGGQALTSVSSKAGHAQCMEPACRVASNC